MSEISKTFSPEQYEAIYLVDEDQDGLRLDQYCAIYLASFSRQQIKKKIQLGQVQILERPYPHKPSVKVYHREKVRIFTPRGTLEDEYWRGEKLELELDPEIIHENDDYLIISKPPYMTTHPTGKHLFNCATVYFENKYKKTIHSVHRLDRETSGIQILAKNPKTAESLGSLFENDKISKCYFLIAHKNSKVNFPFHANERLGQKDDFLPRLFVHCFNEDSSFGKNASTYFELLAENNNYLMALAFPITGRQHQIRAHASFHHFPLVGDKLYNGDPKVFMRFKDEVPTDDDFDKMQISRHALHAMAITYKCPIQNQNVIYFANLPSDLTKLVSTHFPEFELHKLLGDVKSIAEKVLKKLK